MTLGCPEPEIRRLVHAYELGLLSEPDVDRVERHILECSVCAESVEAFSPAGAMLRLDSALLQEARQGDYRAFKERLWRYMWPSIPLPLRPAVLLAAILLLAFTYILETEPPAIRRSAQLNLYETRSSNARTIELTGEHDLVVTFVHRDAERGRSYAVSLEALPNDTVWTDSNFQGIDAFETGQIIVPPQVLKNGDYRLTVSDAASAAETTRSGVTTYIFRVTKQR